MTTAWPLDPQSLLGPRYSSPGNIPNISLDWHWFIKQHCVCLPRKMKNKISHFQKKKLRLNKQNKKCLRVLILIDRLTKIIWKLPDKPYFNFYNNDYKFICSIYYYDYNKYRNLALVFYTIHLSWCFWDGSSVMFPLSSWGGFGVSTSDPLTQMTQLASI